MNKSSGVFFQALSLASQEMPNKACTGQVGLVAIFGHFSGFGLFQLSGIFPARPQTTNANRWAD